MRLSLKLSIHSVECAESMSTPPRAGSVRRRALPPKRDDVASGDLAPEQGDAVFVGELRPRRELLLLRFGERGSGHREQPQTRRDECLELIAKASLRRISTSSGAGHGFAKPRLRKPGKPALDRAARPKCPDRRRRRDTAPSSRSNSRRHSCRTRSRTRGRPRRSSSNRNDG